VEPELEPSVLATLREQMGEDYEPIRAIFEAESGKHLEELRLGIETRSWERARRAAHSLKSSAALFGLAGLSATMREVEHMPDATPPDAWRDRLARAQKQRESGLAWLRDQPK